MQDTVRYLLPAIPNTLYGGLGRHQIERLVALRKAGEMAWERHARKSLSVDFETLFHEVLSPFDLAPAEFSLARAQDELIGQMARQLGVGYNLLDLDIGIIGDRQNTMMRPPREANQVGTTSVIPSNPSRPDTSFVQYGESNFPPPPPRVKPATRTHAPTTAPEAGLPAATTPDTPADEATPLRAPIVLPAAGTERLQAIRQLVAEHAGESRADFVLPIQADGLYPITDVWRIEPGLDTPEYLRTHIAQFAREIAEETGLTECIAPVDHGVGFVCKPPSGLPADPGRAVWDLLSLLGGDSPPVLSDTGLIKLFRLLRLSRRLLDLEAGAEAGG
jgi:hypothetical protein